MSKRQKAPAVEIPETLEEARSLAVDHAANLADIEAIEAERLLKIAEVNKDCDERRAPRDVRARLDFGRLKGWWEAHGHEVVGSKRSGNFGGLLIGFRMTPPTLKMPKGEKVGDVLAWMRSKRGAIAQKFLRTKVELDREAMITALKAAPNDAGRKLLTDKGLSLTSRDEFFVEPLPRGDGGA